MIILSWCETGLVAILDLEHSYLEVSTFGELEVTFLDFLVSFCGGLTSREEDEGIGAFFVWICPLEQWFYVEKDEAPVFRLERRSVR